MTTAINLNLYDKVDENDDLELYHFNYEYEYDDSNLKLKGIVVDKNTKEIVCTTSIHNIEYDIQHINHVPAINEIDWGKSVVTISHEGCFLRVFYHNGRWYISTHRKLDANNSRWGSKYSFKDLFVDALRELYKGDDFVFDLERDFFNLLNKNLVYTFLLRNNQNNRIVCNAPSKTESKIYYTGYFPKGNEHNYIPNLDSLEIFENLRISQKIPVKNMTDIVQFVSHQSYKYHQGVIVFYSDTNGTGKTHIFKLMCPKYLEYKEIRNNCSNLIYRYAQLRRDNVNKEKIIELFPQFSYDFFQFENTLNKIATHVPNQYINRFLKKQYAAVTPLQYKVTKKLREWYLEAPNKNYINSEIVWKFINNESPLYVYKLVIEFNNVEQQT